MYYVKNTSYSLLQANCLQITMEGFGKGKLNDGTSVASFIKEQLENEFLADVVPNSAEDIFYQIFLNRKFTKEAARKSVRDMLADILNKSVYAEKSQHYSQTLENRK